MQRKLKNDFALASRGTGRVVAAAWMLVTACGPWAVPAVAQDAACRQQPTSACVFAAAEEAASALTLAGPRAGAFKYLALAYARLGRLDEARTAVAPSPFVGCDLCDLAKAAAQAGHFEPAMDVARSIPSPEERAWAWILVARAAVTAGKGDLALRAIETAQQVPGQSATVALAKALELARAGRFDQALVDQALEVAGGIGDAVTRAGTLERVAGALADAGRLDQAVRVAGQITEPSMHALALAAVGLAFAGAGQIAPADQLFDEAWRVARDASDVYQWNRPLRAWVQADIAVTMGKANRVALAETRADGIDDQFKRAWALAKIGEALAQAGDDTQARRLFERGVAVVRRLGRPYLSSVVRIVARAGHIDAAEQLVAMIDSGYVQADVLGDIAIAAAERGRYDQALRIIYSIPVGGAYARTQSVPKSECSIPKG